MEARGKKLNSKCYTVCFGVILVFIMHKFENLRRKRVETAVKTKNNDTFCRKTWKVASCFHFFCFYYKTEAGTIILETTACKASHKREYKMDQHINHNAWNIFVHWCCTELYRHPSTCAVQWGVSVLVFVLLLLHLLRLSHEEHRSIN